MMLKKIVAISSAAFLVSGSAFADETLSFVTRFDSESGIVQLEGKGSGNITVRIAPDDVLPEEFETKVPLVFDSVFADGEFVYECQLPAGSAGGGYKVYLRDSSATVSDTFRYFLLEDANDIINNGGINAALYSKDYDTFSTVIKANAETLGIDAEDEVYKSKSAEIINTLYRTNESFSDGNVFFGKYNQAYAIAALEDAKQTDIENIFTKYETYLGISAKDDYCGDERLSDSAKTTLCSLVAEFDFTKGLEKGDTFKGMFEGLKAVAVVKSAEKWQDISKAMTDTFKDEFEFVFDENKDHKGMSSLTPVYSNMISSISRASTLEDVQRIFNSSVSSIVSKNQGSSSSGGGGGGNVSMPRAEQPTVTPESTVSAMPNPFSDVSSDFWGYNAIVEMASQKIINGYEDGTFRAGQTITRAEFVKLLSVMASLETADSDFDDVSPDSWYSPYVGAAAKAGIVSGDGTNFNPASPITRQDTAVIVFRLISANNPNVFGNKKIFADDSSVATYAKDAVAFLGGLGVVNGLDGGNFNPNGILTRAEAAQLLFNAAEYIK